MFKLKLTYASSWDINTSSSHLKKTRTVIANPSEDVLYREKVTMPSMAHALRDRKAGKNPQIAIDNASLERMKWNGIGLREWEFGTLLTIPLNF